MTGLTGLKPIDERLDPFGRARRALHAAGLGASRRDADLAEREVSVPAARVRAEVLERESLVAPGADEQGSRQNGSGRRMDKPLLGTAVAAARPVTVGEARVEVEVIPRA
jgi:hypothetical protein